MAPQGALGDGAIGNEMRGHKETAMSVSSDDLYLCLQHDLRFFSGLTPGEWPPEATYQHVAAAQLLASFYKKFVDKVSPEADNRAFDKFLAVNESCGKWELQAEKWHDELVGELRRSIYDFWNPSGYPLVSSFAELYSFARPGPGSSVGARGQDFYTKIFASPLTAGSSVLTEMWADYVRYFPNWVDAEVIRKTHYGKPSIVEGSRFHFVPKNVDISRLICVEPSLNTFFQLGFGAVIENRLFQAFGLDFSCQQSRSRELAKLGSLEGGPNGYATIDLSSASDSMSLRMLDYFLPRDFVSWLRMLRCERGYRGGSPTELRMVSTMGNGFTFPLQTMLFSCIVSAAARVNGVHLERSRGEHLGNFSVFGDDIVCPSAIARDVLTLLRLLGFEVNPQKTFIDGPFRESCGGDFFQGHHVRGVYVKTLRVPQARYALINALNLWSAKTGISLPKTVRYLLRSVRYQPVPAFENDDAGVKVPFSMTDHLPVSKRYQSVMYRRSVARAKYLKFEEGRVTAPKGARRRILNPSGSLIAFLRGGIVSGRAAIRHDKLRYQTKWGVAPYWDYLPSDSSIALLVDWPRWNNAVHCNFF